MEMAGHILETDEIFRTIYEESPIGIELYDREGRLRRVNKACAKIFGLADTRDAMGFDLFADPNVSDQIKADLKNGKEARYTAPFSFEAVRVHRLYPTTKTGVIHIDVIITPLKAGGGNPAIGYLVQVQDITDLKGIEEELKRISLIDRLTGLYNRAYFEQELVRIKKGRFEAAGIVVCDVDGLKEINDSQGHLRGDELAQIRGRADPHFVPGRRHHRPDRRRRVRGGHHQLHAGGDPEIPGQDRTEHRPVQRKGGRPAGFRVARIVVGPSFRIAGRDALRPGRRGHVRREETEEDHERRRIGGPGERQARRNRRWGRPLIGRPARARNP